MRWKWRPWSRRAQVLGNCVELGHCLAYQDPRLTRYIGVVVISFPKGVPSNRVLISNLPSFFKAVYEGNFSIDYFLAGSSFQAFLVLFFKAETTRELDFLAEKYIRFWTEELRRQGNEGPCAKSPSEIYAHLIQLLGNVSPTGVLRASKRHGVVITDGNSRAVTEKGCTIEFLSGRIIGDDLGALLRYLQIFPFDSRVIVSGIAKRRGIVESQLGVVCLGPAGPEFDFHLTQFEQSPMVRQNFQKEPLTHQTLGAIIFRNLRSLKMATVSVHETSQFVKDILGATGECHTGESSRSEEEIVPAAVEVPETPVEDFLRGQETSDVQVPIESDPSIIARTTPAPAQAHEKIFTIPESIIKVEQDPDATLPQDYSEPTSTLDEDWLVPDLDPEDKIAPYLPPRKTYTRNSLNLEPAFLKLARRLNWTPEIVLKTVYYVEDLHSIVVLLDVHNIRKLDLVKEYVAMAEELLLLAEESDVLEAADEYITTHFPLELRDRTEFALFDEWSSLVGNIEPAVPVTV